ncbi:MAG: preprotein translocase subunit SecG [Methylococcales bacterium]
MYQALIIVHVLLAIGIISLVLLQQGKGADAGAAFGSGASGTVFGAQGSANFLTRATAVLATLFFATSLGLAVVGDTRQSSAGFMDIPAIESVPTDMPPVQQNPNPAPPVSDIPPVPGATNESTQSEEPVKVEESVKADESVEKPVTPLQPMAPSAPVQPLAPLSPALPEAAPVEPAVSPQAANPGEGESGQVTEPAAADPG